ncbi:MAG TPA: hypothetical protein VN455_05180 [Methanotrichaceae archaeon]|nr:hypothetical protein [Methanotrichaceae archaeon]
MLNDLEMALALVEGQDCDSLSAVKDSWQRALEEASEILHWPARIMVQYSPGIWRNSRYLVGMRLLSNPWDEVLIFEFATPNSVLAFDCFDQDLAKVGVMLHEFAHLIDDDRWGFDLGGLAHEAGQFITREQRAELLAFAAHPAGVFEANLALVKSTARMLGVDLGEHARAIAAVETMGHAGMAGDADPVEVFRGVQDAGIPADEILEKYLCTFAFSLAGLTTVPDQNERQGLGIKRSEDLEKANEWLCRHLRGEIGRAMLQEMLEDIGYYAFSEEDYDPMSCVDFGYLDRKMALENISRARSYFTGEPCFADLLNALDDLGMKLQG